MKTFTILEAIEYLTNERYFTDRITSIKYNSILDNKYTFDVVFESGHTILLNMDDETII